MDGVGGRGWRLRRSRVAVSLARHAVAGIVPGDHVCASFGSDEEQLERTRRRVVALERRRDELQAEISALEGRREQVRAEIVRYEAGTGSALVRAKDVKPFTIPIEHR